MNIGVASALLFVSALQLQAANILVFQGETINPNTSIIPGAFALIPGHNVTTTTSSGAFNTALSGGPWDLIVYAEQDRPTFADSEAQISSFVSGGGKIIGYTGSSTGAMPTFFQAVSLATNVWYLSNDLVDPIFNSPFALNTDGQAQDTFLTNPGYAVYSNVWGTTGGSVGLGWTVWGGHQAILGNSGKSILNAGVTDAYSTPEEGQRLLANQVTYFVGAPSAVPEPTNVLPLAALIGAGFMFRNRRAPKVG